MKGRLLTKSELTAKIQQYTTVNDSSLQVIRYVDYHYVIYEIESNTVHTHENHFFHRNAVLTF